jgi:hypothetical protein
LVHDAAAQVPVENTSLEAIGWLEADCAIRPNGIGSKNRCWISRLARATNAAAALAMVCSSPLDESV